MAGADRTRRGGICGLAAFLDEHCEAVEADLATYYGPDDQLARLWTGGLSYRRLKVLIEGLPPESATMTRLLKDAPAPDPGKPREHGPWSREMHLLADIVDELKAAAWQRTGDEKNPRPEPVSRPGVTLPKPESPSHRRYLDKVRAGHGDPNANGADDA